MNFKRVSSIPYHIDRVWTAMRDELPELVSFLENIDSIKMESHEKGPDVHKVVSTWTATPQFSRTITKHMNSDILTWTDHGEWNENQLECLWNIKHHNFGDFVRCSGTTKFEQVNGGKGTKITFTGSFDWNEDYHEKGVKQLIGGIAFVLLEFLIKDLVRKNCSNTIDALTKYLRRHRR